MSRTARVLAAAGIVGMAAVLAPAAHAAPARPDSVVATATCPDYLFMSDTPGSTDYVDYCGPGDVVQIECRTVYDGANWDELVLDEDVFRGWVTQASLSHVNPKPVTLC